MMDAAQAAKAKENVRPSTPARHLEARRAAVPRARRSEPASPRSNNRRPGRRSFLYSPFRRLNRRVASAPDREAHPAPPYPPPAEIQKGQSGRREDEGACRWWRRGSVLRKLHAGSRARPPPPRGRDRLAHPTRSITHGLGWTWSEIPEPSAATAVIATGPIAATTTAATTAGTNAGDHERRASSAIDAWERPPWRASSLLGASMPPPPPAAPAAFEPPPAPIVVPPRASRWVRIYSTPPRPTRWRRWRVRWRRPTTTDPPRSPPPRRRREIRGVRDWLVGCGLGRRGEREDNGLPRAPGGYAVAAAATLDARRACASNKPLESGRKIRRRDDPARRPVRDILTRVASRRD